MTEDDIIINAKSGLALGWGRLDRYDITHARRDGTRQTVLREVYDHGSAAAVLLHAPRTDTVVLTRQFRLPPHLNGDPAWMIEVPAGLLDGEQPELAARREAIEETGYDPENLELVCNSYASPGSLTEKCACFLGTYTPGRRASAGGGLAAEGEDIEVFEIGFTQAIAMVASGEIMDAKTILLLQALALRQAQAAK